MTLFDLRKKIRERKAQWENHPVGAKYFEFADQHAQELDWVLQELENMEKELSSRISQLEKEVEKDGLSLYGIDGRVIAKGHPNNFIIKELRGVLENEN